jgi:hypothetical protein
MGNLQMEVKDQENSGARLGSGGIGLGRYKGNANGKRNPTVMEEKIHWKLGQSCSRPVGGPRADGTDC